MGTKKKRTKWSLFKESARCLNCGNIWLPYKDFPAQCPCCSSKKVKPIKYKQYFMEKITGTEPKYPYRKNWGKPDHIKRISEKEEGSNTE